MASKFDQRSYEKEKIDALDVAGPDLDQNLKELDFINTYLGGYSISLSAIQAVCGRISETQVSILDVGCGAGDLLHYFDKRMKRSGFIFTGLDANPNIITYAQRKHTEYTFICADAFDIESYPVGVDIIHACLFCHHFTEKELENLFRVFKRKAGKAVVINDLHRNSIAYYSIKWLTALFSKSLMVKNDAPLSVWRGFKKKELKELFKNAGFTRVDIRWKWAFRYQVIAWM